MFEGRTLRFDREVLVGVLRSIEEKSGLDARSAFIGRFRAAGVSPTLLRGTERPGLYQDILKGLDDAAAALDHEHEEFCRQFEAQAIAAAHGILNDSEAKLKAERERLGDKAQGGRLKAAALELVPHATMVDKLARESAAALERFTKASANDPFGLTTKPLFEESEARRKRWQEASEAYEAERRPRVAAQPSLAMYADQPGAAEKLRRLSAMSDDEVGATATKEIDERLENIATVRPEIGAGFKVWGQSHLRRVTLDQLQATPLQRVDRRPQGAHGRGRGRRQDAVHAARDRARDPRRDPERRILARGRYRRRRGRRRRRASPCTRSARRSTSTASPRPPTRPTSTRPRRSPATNRTP